MQPNMIIEDISSLDVRSVISLLENCTPLIGLEPYETLLYDPLYNAYLIYKNGGLLVKNKNSDFLVINDFYSLGVHASIILRSLRRNVYSDIENLLQSNQLCRSRGLVIRNWREILRPSGSLQFNIEMFQDFSNRVNTYASEENFPQIVYRVEGLSQALVRDRNACQNDVLLPQGGVFSSYRYMVRRCLNRLPFHFFSDNYHRRDFYTVIDQWSMIMKGNCAVNDRHEFEQYWEAPIRRFIDYLLDQDEDSARMTVRVFYVEDKIEGYWIGAVLNGCMNVYQILHTRKNKLFGDRILIDILSYSTGLDCDYINLGGAEEVSLYNYKKKYLDAFEGSFEIAVNNVVFSSASAISID